MPENASFIDTPDGRLLIATVPEAHLGALKRLLVKAFKRGYTRGYREGVAAMEAEMERLLVKDK